MSYSFSGVIEALCLKYAPFILIKNNEKYNFRKGYSYHIYKTTDYSLRCNIFYFNANILNEIENTVSTLIKKIKEYISKKENYVYDAINIIDLICQVNLEFLIFNMTNKRKYKSSYYDLDARKVLKGDMNKYANMHLFEELIEIFQLLCMKDFLIGCTPAWSHLPRMFYEITDTKNKIWIIEKKSENTIEMTTFLNKNFNCIKEKIDKMDIKNEHFVNTYILIRQSIYSLVGNENFINNAF